MSDDRRLRVVIAEDSVLLREGIARILEEAGYEIVGQSSTADDLLLKVRSYDPELCGEVGYSARVGDLRHNFLFYWPYSSQAPWGGIANWNADPLTGRIIGASATTMGRSATFSAAMVRDLVMVANGELDVEDITSGVPAYLYQ